MITSIDRIWDEGYQKIMSDERHMLEQKLWVKEASEQLRKLPAVELYKREFLYIPNDIFMLHFFGAEIADYKYGVYREDHCNFYKRLVFPIRGFNGQVAGLGGWANDSQWTYIYSPDTCWDKSRYFYITPEDFAKALEDDYLIIVDGIFDSISLNHLELHAASLMGSNLSNWHRQYLKMFKYIIVIPDNDNAGVALTKKVKKFRKDAIVIQQGKYKDIDDFIKYSDTKQLIKECNNLALLQAMQKVVLH